MPSSSTSRLRSLSFAPLGCLLALASCSSGPEPETTTIGLEPTPRAHLEGLGAAPPGACAAGSTELQYFGTYADSTGAVRPVVGCSGAVPWPKRTCGPGWQPAPSLAWTESYAISNIAPTHAYWTNDNLGYAGVGSGHCSAAVGLTSCGSNQPMRVCPNSGTDSEGNACNWVGCSDGGGGGGMYYGGCVGNLTAGVLCQQIAPVGPYQRPISLGGSGVDTYGDNVIGSCAITPATGLLQCWGRTLLGSGESSSLSPQLVPGIDTAATTVATTPHQTCVVTADGALRCSASEGNSVGMLGTGDLVERTTFVSPVSLDSRAADVALFGTTACALTQAGAVKCWGEGIFGQGQSPPSTTVNGQPVFDVPTPVVGLGAGVTALAVVTNNYDYFDVIDYASPGVCALTQSGSVQCWGRAGLASWGLLGDGMTSSLFSTVPVTVPGLSGGVVALSSGVQACALTNTGVVKCWGDDAGGSSSAGFPRSTVPTVVAGLPPGIQGLAQGTPAGGNGGGAHQCAWTTWGIWCWGANGQGQLGDGTTTDSAAAVRVQSLPSGVVSWVAVGDWGTFGHTCARVGGHVYCWGSNAFGALGVGNNQWNSVTPVPVPGM